MEMEMEMHVNANTDFKTTTYSEDSDVVELLGGDRCAELLGHAPYRSENYYSFC